MPKQKAGQENKRRYLERVQQLLIQYVPTSQVVRTCVEEFGCDERTVYRYIGEVRAAWAKQHEYAKESQANRMQALEARRKFIQDAILAGEWQVALNAMRDLARLEGLYDRMPEDD